MFQLINDRELQPMVGNKDFYLGSFWKCLHVTVLTNYSLWLTDSGLCKQELPLGLKGSLLPLPFQTRQAAIGRPLGS